MMENKREFEKVPVPAIAFGRARTPEPAISPARKIAAVMTPSPCFSSSNVFFASSPIVRPDISKTF